MSVRTIEKAILLMLLVISVSGAPTQGTVSASDEHTVSTHHQDHQDGVCSVDAFISYDLPFHIAAIFIILVTSGLGVFSSLILGKYPSFKIATYAVNIARYFGTGVILAVGLIHLFPSALFTLTNPCVPAAIRTNYAPFAGFLAMFAALVLQFLEYLANWYMQKHSKHSEEIEVKQAGLTTSEVKENVPYMSEECHAHGNLFTFEDRRISTYMLEFGIATHSIVIGLSLGVASGSGFPSLLAAIVFHQFFEGIALGVKIGELSYKNRVTPYLAALFYSLITPTGIAIGVGTHSIYNTNSVTSLLVIGIFDAISAGILIYMAFVNLIAIDFHNSTKFTSQSGIVKCAYYVAMWLGAGAMALIGRWA
ncbi:ZIP zinc/iron transport family [Basidiobolus meristosporus CBS 931.73]|uniref:ZIP zinc/iron transport family n=1 Tax=Basidiobolus meristosporus CBS 931.73 TaxID=1314790 RepID=A0A1Y1XS14_9FUNG|nr:ZIP zinc/iron transport family [Basidiobolus meristosporus CBS 931.73]|eukprot:ORX88523.1 ZIP zinc/iron transport family [Basidiobolus meristosporus CBS 931.73]